MIKAALKVPNELKLEIINFVSEGKKYFQFNGPGRKYCPLNRTEEVLKIKVAEFANYCYGTFNINVIPEPKFGNFIGVNTDGGAVHPHKDPRSVNNEVHVRINFLVSKPHIGGMPVINNTEYNIDEGDCWVNLASEELHQSTKVQGDKPRIVLSLGSYVNENQIPNFTR